ncbi:hypothetical protein BO218_03510 [Microbacterium paludicola]|nr:hypothetical protein BO218_03510 [Microbacterium paludicola]
MAVFRETQDELDSISRVGFDANETFGLLAMRLKKTATDANGETKEVLTEASEAFSEWISLNAPLTPDGSIPLEVDHPMWMLEAECS